MRPAVLALAAALAAPACTASDSASCPGTPAATFRFKGPLVPGADALVAAADPFAGLLDCTPDPADPAAPIRYPRLLPPFEARLSYEDGSGAAALCRANGSVLSGARTGERSFSVEADADAAILCDSSCVASLRVVVAGDVGLDGSGEPASFVGILVEVLSETRGACDGCLPAVPDADPPARACAARYALSGAPP
ncbi:MAG TPA: hypothetical protein VFL83_18385 [Anaeromyxobacter sp.]|nr:hypothetical protein [Anaeromyxobacter sp.]